MKRGSAYILSAAALGVLFCGWFTLRQNHPAIVSGAPPRTLTFPKTHIASTAAPSKSGHWHPTHTLSNNSYTIGTGSPVDNSANGSAVSMSGGPGTGTRGVWDYCLSMSEYHRDGTKKELPVGDYPIPMELTNTETQTNCTAVITYTDHQTSEVLGSDTIVSGAPAGFGSPMAVGLVHSLSAPLHNTFTADDIDVEVVVRATDPAAAWSFGTRTAIDAYDPERSDGTAAGNWGLTEMRYTNFGYDYPSSTSGVPDPEPEHHTLTLYDGKDSTDTITQDVECFVTIGAKWHWIGRGRPNTTSGYYKAPYTMTCQVPGGIDFALPHCSLDNTTAHVIHASDAKGPPDNIDFVGTCTNASNGSMSYLRGHYVFDTTDPMVCTAVSGPNNPTQSWGLSLQAVLTLKAPAH